MRGRVRIIMALRVLTLHLLSQLVIHISPHVPHAESYFFLLGYVRPGYILHRDSELVQYLQNLGREGPRAEHHRKIELEMARPNKTASYRDTVCPMGFREVIIIS